MSDTTGTTPASAGDHTLPTLDELATLAEELGDPLHHSLVLLEMIRDDGTDIPFDIGAALMALVEQADQRRKVLMENLCRLAKSEQSPHEVQSS